MPFSEKIEMVQLGQLVRLINQPPNFGRSLDGTIARVTWVPPKPYDAETPAWMRTVFVDYYRRHRRTGKPLAIRTASMKLDRLEPITEVTVDEADLYALVEPMRRERDLRRSKMRADREAWEQRILAMADPEAGEDTVPTREKSKRELAQATLADLENRLTSQPPPGISQADIASFFHRQRETLLNALLAAIDGVVAEPSLVSKLSELVEEGYPFDITIQRAGETYLYVVMPDVDGIEVMNANSVRTKLANAEDGPSLLTEMVRNLPQLQGGKLIAIEHREDGDYDV